MRIAVLADIHSNYTAFKRCVDYIEEQGINTYIFLGDYISDCAYPQDTLDLLYKIKEEKQCFILKGNREEYMLAHHTGDERYTWVKGSSQTGSLLYTYENLREKDLDFFESLPISATIEIKGCTPFEIAHGSLENSRGWLYPNNEESQKTVEQMKTNLLVNGHIHLMRSTTYGDKKIVTVGAVGVPLESNGKSQFAILEYKNNEWQEEFVTLEYDIEAEIQRMDKSGLSDYAPAWIRAGKKTLRTGDNIPLELLSLAHQYREKEGDTKLEERHFEVADKELGI